MSQPKYEMGVKGMELLAESMSGVTCPPKTGPGTKLEQRLKEGGRSEGGTTCKGNRLVVAQEQSMREYFLIEKGCENLL